MGSRRPSHHASDATEDVLVLDVIGEALRRPGGRDEVITDELLDVLAAESHCSARQPDDWQ